MTKRRRLRFDAPETDRHDVRIGFRPGREFGEWLSGFAKCYGLSRGEAIKRLAIIATKRFSGPDHYELLAQLHDTYVDRFGPRRESFLLTCTIARNSLDEKAAELGDIVKGGFTTDETTKLLTAVLKVYATGEPTDLTLTR